jgi:hypothetical protein
VGQDGFEPPKLSQQIYSLPHLATLELPQLRAEEGTRTPDQLITNQLLYQLSYFGNSFNKKGTPPKLGDANVLKLLLSNK